MDKSHLATIRYWGASTSSHQVEGKNHNQWTRWELDHANELARSAHARFGQLPSWPVIQREAASPENYVSGVANDHYHRYEEDYDFLVAMNMNAYRFSVEWSRIEPRPGEWSDEAFNTYRTMLASLKKRGITPFLTLWHFTNPEWFESLGGFTKKENVEHFVRFAEKVTAELGEYIDNMITINEPNIYAALAFAQGEFPPSRRSPITAMRVHRNLIKAHNAAVPRIKTVRPAIRVGIAQNVSHVRRANANPLSFVMAFVQRAFWNEYALNRTDAHSDFIGLNYYFSDRWCGRFMPHNEQDKVSDMGFTMRPADIEHVLRRLWSVYKKPIIIAENGVADHADTYRKWWIWETLAATSRALADGVEVEGYLHWSLLDNFEWAHGFWPRFGLVEVDRQTLQRTLRPSGKWFGGVIKSIRLEQSD